MQRVAATMHADAPGVLAAPEIVVATPGPSPEAHPALALTDIVRRMGQKEVLTGASLSIPAGIIGWLGGPNGSGKTTLLRIAAGVLVPESGSVALAGLDPERERRAFHRRLGFLSAGDRGLYARLTVLQNLEFWASVVLVPPRRRQGLIESALKRFQLDDLARTRVDRQSMGQRQRVRLAMTFLHEPDLVLLDEPHTSLDQPALELLDVALDELAARGGAALWCSPAHASAPLRADVRYRMSSGRVVSD